MFYTDPRYELSIKKVWQVSLPKVTMHDFYTLLHDRNKYTCDVWYNSCFAYACIILNHKKMMS